ncbi:protein kinase domain-containing protein [Streptomyces lonarensis]|uniref:non-specific serine/threonine protein kinase n=1 Tax=Streptomyces lonarensis TaxID=700599 RepID=A0A7X6D4V8_9ACTN|nr:protein kinase [Streptomyces lonarensis]NJQ08244.1 serine/threonine protein kinase [Streptomyces lonarensis]
MNEHAVEPADYSGRAVGGGRYQLRTLLGTGGMASVNLAYDTVLAREVAVKTMHGELGRDESFRERFKREAQSVARLTHANIVSVFDTGEDTIDGLPVPFIVMEYVDGRPLRSVLDDDIREFGAMPGDKALKVIADVCAALDISHEMGLVHRDIKPGNVMVTKRNVVKVMDFGIARAMQSGVTAMTQTGMVVGTPQYLSPEQALGRGVDARSDLYSVGIMLFELLTGHLPFDADSPLAVAYAHVQEQPPAPSSINASVPPQLDALVERMLRKNPDERFQSAEELREESLRVAGTLTGAAPRITATGPVSRSGDAVANSVFPQYGTNPPGAPAPGTPPPAGYAPTPQPQGYGYPQHTPPPYVMAPPAAHSAAGAGTGSGGGGNGGKTFLMALAGVVAVALIVGVAFIVVNGSDDSGDIADGGSSETDTGGTDAGDGGDAGAGGDADSDADEDTDTETEREPRFKEGDTEKTVDVSVCLEPRDFYDQEEHPGAVTMPNFYDKHVASVKECLRAGTEAHEGEGVAWNYANDIPRDEVIKGQGIVVDQSPKAHEAYNPLEDEIVLTVSTGKEATR